MYQNNIWMDDYSDASRIGAITTSIGSKVLTTGADSYQGQFYVKAKELKCESNLIVDGTTTLTGGLSTIGDVTVGGNLTINGRLTGFTGMVSFFATPNMAYTITGWVLCDGRAVTKGTTTNTLFGVIGYAFGGSGDLFNVPDLRGQFLRGSDNDNNRVFSSGTTSVPNHTHTIGSTDIQHSHYLLQIGANKDGGNGDCLAHVGNGVVRPNGTFYYTDGMSKLNGDNQSSFHSHTCSNPIENTATFIPPHVRLMAYIKL